MKSSEKELTQGEIARREYLQKYGSFLYCDKRNTLCVHMDGMWLTGCELETCILDDPRYQQQQRNIEENRRRNEAALRRQREEEKTAAPIWDQRNLIKSHVERSMERIRKTEEESQRAFRENNPNRGQQLFVRAGMMRQELKAWQEKNGVEWNNLQEE